MEWIRKKPEFSGSGFFRFQGAVFPVSGIKTAQITRLQNACAGNDIGGGAQGDFVFLRHVPHGGKCLLHDADEAFVDFGLRPEEAGKVLHPLEVADGDAACVGDDVGHDEHAFGLQDDVITAYYRMETLELVAKSTFHARLLISTKGIEEDEIARPTLERLFAMRANYKVTGRHPGYKKYNADGTVRELEE